MHFMKYRSNENWSIYTKYSNYESASTYHYENWLHSDACFNFTCYNSSLCRGPHPSYIVSNMQPDEVQNETREQTVEEYLKSMCEEQCKQVRDQSERMIADFIQQAEEAKKSLDLLPQGLGFLLTGNPKPNST